MTPEVKRLVPGIHMLGQRLMWEGKATRPITLEEARVIAEKVYLIPNIEEEMMAIRSEIECMVGIPFHMLAS